MDRIGIRELRNDTSRVVKRARAGELFIVTINGVPAAEIGPLSTRSDKRTLEELVAAGLVRPRMRRPEPGRARPIPAEPGSPTTAELLLEDRGDD